uniref:Uncharacterized protein n=1 Tax=Arundo donax TaxID=35708 RepID=A0A0A9DER0_ARUDO
MSPEIGEIPCLWFLAVVRIRFCLLHLRQI